MLALHQHRHKGRFYGQFVIQASVPKTSETTELGGTAQADAVIVARAGAWRMFHDGFLHDWPNRVHLARKVAAGSPLGESGESRAADWVWTPPLWSEGTFQSAIARRAASIPRFGLPAGHVGRRDHTPWQQSDRESVFANPFVHQPLP